MKKFLLFAALIVAFTVSAQETVEHTYAVAGAPANLFGMENDWDQVAAPEMTLNEGIYEWTSAATELEAGNIEFKVVQDHAWDVCYPENNYVVPVEEAGKYILNVTYNPENNEVNATLEAYVEPEPEHTYAVAGAPAALFGMENDWDQVAAPEMTLNEGIYEWTSAETELEAGNIEFKVVQDHAWDVCYPENNYVVAVEEAGKYILNVTYNPENNEVNATLEAVVEPEPEHTYAVAGAPANLFGMENDWDQVAAPEMTLNEGIYEWTSAATELEAGNIEFKVVQDHAWDVCYPENNYVVAVEEAGKYILNVTYNPENNEVNATLEAVVEPEPEHIYAVAGAPAALFGMEFDWDEVNAPEMTLNEETGLYEWTSAETELEAGNIEFKVVQDHAWDVCYPENNYVVAVEEAGKYTLAVTYNPEDNAVNATLEAVVEPEPEHTYAVAGAPAALFGMENDWDEVNAPEMTLNEETGLYEWTSAETELEAGNIEFKVVQDHAWEVCYPENNYEVAVEAAGKYILAVTYNPETNEVNATLTGEATPEQPMVYIIGEVNGNGWAPNVGVEMDTEDGVVFTKDVVLSHDGRTVDPIGDNQYSFFSFATKLMEAADDWDGLAPYRFGAVSEATDDNPNGDFRFYKNMMGQPLSLTSDGGKAFQVEDGTYTLTINMEDMTLTIVGESATAIETINVDNNVKSGRYNLMGQPVDENYKGIVIENGVKKIQK